MTVDRRTFLLRGSAALAAAAFAAVLPKQAAPAATETVPPLLHYFKDAYGQLQIREIPETPRGGLTLMQAAIRQGGLPTPSELATVQMFERDSPAIRILGGEVKIDRFRMDDYVPQPRTLYLNPTLLAQAKGPYGDSFGGVLFRPYEVSSHWTLRQARLQGPARRRLLRGR